ncbi:MAG: amino acid adenylation domain-containing protein [Rhizobacter sp.]
MSGARSLRSGFLRSVEQHGDRPALQLDAAVLSYSQLCLLAATLAQTLNQYAPAGEPALTAVFAHRSVTAYAGVLGGLFRGHGYVPLNPSFPTDRTRGMLIRSECQSLIVDANGAAQLTEVLRGVERPLVLLLPDHDDVSAFAVQWPQHRFIGKADLIDGSSWTPGEVDANGIAYLLFTSGSTGQPKGVMVAHRNAVPYVDAMVERYAVTEQDRFSQTFDLTFDLSVHDMFVCWERGACLCAPTNGQKMFPGKYINDCGITMWFSVPSTAVLMNKLKMLKPGKYPNLRYSLFCGEALPVEIVEKWAEAAPQSVLENLYGPTELTIACTLYRWNTESSLAEAEFGVVPIGEPYPGMKVLVADEHLHEVAVGEAGELLMTGPQLTLGYYKDAERTAGAFVVPPGQSEVYYRTGDRVRRPSPGKPLVYFGRIDNQIKIQGYRVELGEIEAVMRQEAGVDVAIAIGWPVTASGADGIVGFLGADTADTAAIRERVISRLPPYMHPSELRLVSEFPLNANGKVDRKALLASLSRQAEAVE